MAVYLESEFLMFCDETRLSYLSNLHNADIIWIDSNTVSLVIRE